MIPVSEIQQLIADLQETTELMEKVLSEYCSNPNYAIGVIETNKETTRRLKELIKNANDSSRVSGNAEETECQQNAE